MKNVSTVGIDLAKEIFQLCGMDKKGKVLFNKKVKRDKLVSFIEGLEREGDFLIAMEACGVPTILPVHCWGRDIIQKLFLPNSLNPL